MSTPTRIKHFEFGPHAGKLSYEEYCENNTLHRLNGPAIISYYGTGSVAHEVYIVNGEYHRVGGPAIIRYLEDGSIFFTKNMIHGKCVS